MSIRKRLVIVCVVAAHWALSHSEALAQNAAGSRTATRRPNILFAISDDQSWPHAGAYGCEMVDTPAFDRIARDGVLFTHAFCAASQCSISRATILTGRYLWELEEAGIQASLFPSKLTVYTDLLEADEYHVGYTGKPWGPGNWQAGGRTSNPSGKAYNSRRLDPPTSQISSTDYAANFADFLSDRSDDAPFCFWYGCHEPHRNYEEGTGLRSGKQLKDVEVPPYYPDNEIVRSDLLDYFLEIEWFDRHLAKMIDLLEQSGELNNTLIIVTSDNGLPFPRAKATLFEDGIRMPFAVHWPARIAGGQVNDELVSFVDIAPTILEAVGLDVPGGMTGRSLLPMLTGQQETAAEPFREYVLLGKERHNHARADNVGYPVRAIRTDRYLYLRNLKPDRWPMGDPPGYLCHTKMINPTKEFILAHHGDVTAYYYKITYAKKGAEELYDIDADPHCLNNLADDGQFAETKKRLWVQLQKDLTEQGDPRMLGYGDIIDSYPFFGRFQPDIPGFKEIGVYNSAFWPTSRGPAPVLVVPKGD